jgi:uncharacterized membrane protein
MIPIRIEPSADLLVCAVYALDKKQPHDVGGRAKVEGYTPAMTFTETMDRISKGFEIVGVGVLVFGFALSVVQAMITWSRTRSGAQSYKTLRSYFGWSILLSLEVLVAADLIRTVAVQPSLENVAVLGLIIVIRTVLSFSLDVEIEGVLPWRREERGGLAAPEPAEMAGP